MKKLLILSLVLLAFTRYAYADAGSITVGGDFNNYYPVTFSDGGYDNNAECTLELGRSSVHENSSWRGALMSKITYHTTRWGNGANFIDARIAYSEVPFIAGWKDATHQNGNYVIVVWLRGGGTTYHYNSNFTVAPVVYDGIQNALPYQETNGPALTYKTSVDPYVNSTGMSYGQEAYFNGTGESYFNGDVGIGTYDTNGYKLAVKGTIHAQQVLIDMVNFADYVFNKDYSLPPLSDVKTYIDQNHHLPEMPSEKEIADKGLDVGEMNKLLTKKVEELTLYLIEQKAQNEKQDGINQKLQKQLNAIQNQLNQESKH